MVNKVSADQACFHGMGPSSPPPMMVLLPSLVHLHIREAANMFRQSGMIAALLLHHMYGHRWTTASDVVAGLEDLTSLEPKNSNRCCRLSTTSLTTGLLTSPGRLYIASVEFAAPIVKTPFSSLVGRHLLPGGRAIASRGQAQVFPNSRANEKEGGGPHGPLFRGWDVLTGAAAFV